jgi:hypothetical protein
MIASLHGPPAATSRRAGASREGCFRIGGDFLLGDGKGDEEGYGLGRGHVDARTIKTLPSAGLIAEKWPEARQVFLVERYSYGTDGELSGAVAVLDIAGLPPRASAKSFLAQKTDSAVLLLRWLLVCGPGSCHGPGCSGLALGSVSGR